MSQWPNVMNFLLYLAVSLPLMGLGLFLFMRTTPYKENAIIAAGDNVEDLRKRLAAEATACDIGGKLVGLALVMASAIYHSVSLIDLAIWGIVGSVFQVIVFYLFEWVTPFTVVKAIPQGNLAVGMLSAFVSVATGLLMASLISY